MKRWLRSHAGSTTVTEDEVRGISGLCRDILNQPALFPSRNPRSFLQAVAEVYEHLQLQLREVLERDRTCADLVQRTLTLSRNFLSDAISYLLLGPTDLRQTDALPSLEVVALWQSLPEKGHPLAERVNPKLQWQMRDAWATHCGSLLATLLRTQWCVHLFDGGRGEKSVNLTALATADGHGEHQPKAEYPDLRSDVCGRIAEVEAEFENGSYKRSGLAGAFRLPSQRCLRSRYLAAVQAIFELTYFFGEVLVKFQCISEGLGDYGLIRVAPWLHPFLEVLMAKVQLLKSNLEQLHEAVEDVYVLGRARGLAIEKPSPSKQMCARAHACIERAVNGRGCHAQALMQVIDELKGRSAAERLPCVVAGVGEACEALQSVLSSQHFRSLVGDHVPDLQLGAAACNSEQFAHGQPNLCFEDASSYSDVETSTVSTSPASRRTANPRQVTISVRGTASGRACSVPALGGVRASVAGSCAVTPVRRLRNPVTFQGAKGG